MQYRTGLTCRQVIKQRDFDKNSLLYLQH